MSHLRSNSRSRRIRTYSFIIAAAAILRRVGDSGRFGVAPPPPISLSLSTGCGGGGLGRDGCGGGGGGGGGGRDVVVEVVAGMWWWRWWQGCGGRDVVVEVVEEEVKKTWNHVCVVKRSRRPFLMKGPRENKQAADSKPLRAFARRRHKWPEVLLAKKQTPP
ncbi:hypothetical protein HanPSC8_Chr15g0653111 [Helianthus annuus]|nr:hypothetical protein HanIR_Chr15g0739781 [Helianthus annuus]KAJ0830248.1 hypothetical protein HanPSC8_Chr15g0653111 [Helianthus annuus]